LQNENLRQQLAVSHAELAERRSLGEASRNIDIAEYANGKQSSISNNKNFMIPDDEQYSFLIPSSISNNNLIPSSISNNKFMIPHNEQYSYLGNLQPIISQDVAVNNYQQAAGESPTCFPMCMQRGCMSCDIPNHSTVKQMDTEMEMGSFQFGQDIWTSTQQGGLTLSLTLLESSVRTDGNQLNIGTLTLSLTLLENAYSLSPGFRPSKKYITLLS
jgi:hypothetical protein